ncbi:DUF2142 domain-containing protein, partial [Candidatus Saccharibacteria bacterium]|nr:DUF2142 domain-containing protein [Candidatus Saccharibacteria bacterium]
RVTQLSEGDLFMEKIPGGYGHLIPNYIHNVNMDEFTQTKKNNLLLSIQRRYASGEYSRTSGSATQLFEGAGTYSPLTYAHLLPVGVLANYTKLNAYIYTLLLRLSNLLIFLLFVYLAIKLAPTGKWLLVSVGLLPMSIHQAATVSADVILVSSIFIFVALILRTLSEEASIKDRLPLKSLKLLAPIFLAGLLLGGSKPGYFLIVLGVFLIPKSLFKNTRAWASYALGLLVCCALLLGVWSVLLGWSGTGVAVESFRARVNNGGQTLDVSEIVTQTALRPWRTMKLISNTFMYENDSTLPFPIQSDFNKVPDFILSNFTGIFGSLNTPLPDWASFLVILNLLFSFLAFGAKKITLSFRKKLLVFFIIIAQISGLFLVFWKTWTSRTMEHVWGLQGRYFIPLIPLLAFIMPRKSSFTWSKDTTKYVAMSLSCVPLAMMIVMVFETFYKLI